jgi:hypothetical protein
MSARALIVLLALAAATPRIQYFRYERPLAGPAAKAGQTCVVLDAGTFAHAAPELTDVRLYRTDTASPIETAYAIRAAAQVEAKRPELALLNLGRKGSQTVFDAAMPEGQYGDVSLHITAKNFIATVAVTGSQTEAGTEGTELGMYTIFDLSGQKLGRSMVLHLPESNFRYLYFSIAGPLKAADVVGLSVERLPAKQQYVTVADTNQVTQKEKETVVQFTVPAKVPVERVEFIVGAAPANFSREVKVKAQPVLAGEQRMDTEPPAPAESSGTLLRLHATQNGHRIDEEDLAVAAPWASLAGAGSQWTVTVDNGDDAPLAITDVKLEMEQQTLCFDAVAAARYALYYGDASLSAPQYDYAKLFAPEKDADVAALGPEAANPEYQARPDGRAFTERHPALLWVALVLVVIVLGLVALRTAKEAPKG